jgi:chemotaxis protein CheD
MTSAGTSPGNTRLFETTAPQAADVYLHPGHLFASAEPATVTTVLGSCVSVCLFDSDAQLGGINHYLLPHWAGNGTASPRFGNVALRTLYDRVLALGARRKELRAKLFGGACVLEGFQRRQGHLGEQNVERAVEFLQEAGVPVVAQDTGGRRGRKLVFQTGDGAVWIKLL